MGSIICPRVSPKSNPSLLITVIEMALEHEEDESQSQQEQPKRIKTLTSSETLEDPQSVRIFPSDIEIEILLRIPVESLLRCKSVCKSWRCLISDPRFIKYHLSLSNSNSEYAHHRLVICTDKSVRWSSLHDIIYDKSINELELDYPLKHLQKTFWIAGSCNGLCIVVEMKDLEEAAIFIWNPSTRRSNRLPSLGLGASLLMEYGFGYEESSDDYKAVSIGWDIENAKNDIWTMIYSLNSGNWKRIGDFPSRNFTFDSGKFSNGALHWVAKSSSSSWTIISLDLATETYGEVLQPVYDEVDKDLRLGVLGEWLCLVCYYSNNRKTDVWVMKDYGVKDSWTKLASIQNLTDSVVDRFSWPFTIANDGKILMHHGPELVLYDVKNGSFSEIKNYVGGSAWVTVESLVSPNAP